MTLLKTTARDKAVFKVPPKMNKFDIKEYLSSVYQLPVKKVNTANYDGKLKLGSRQFRGKYFRTKSWKKAYVTFHVENPVESSAGEAAQESGTA